MAYPKPSVNQVIDDNILKGADARLQRKRESWYVTDLNRCLRGVYFSREGKIPTEAIPLQTLGKFSVGYMYEAHFLKMAESKNVTLIEEQGSIVWEEYGVRGRWDYLFKVYNTKLLYEIKTMVSKGWGWGFWDRMKSPEGFKANPEHLLQINTYLGLMKKDYPDLEGRLVYISKDCFTRHEIVVKFSEELWEEAEKQFKILHDCWEKKELPPRADPLAEEDGKLKVNFQAKFCEYHDLCMDDKDWEAKATREVGRAYYKRKKEEREAHNKKVAEKNNLSSSSTA